jgi:hypothetical protein
VTIPREKINRDEFQDAYSTHRDQEIRALKFVPIGFANLARRMDAVEHRMDTIEQRLDASYASLSSQILQSRRETHDEMFATRADLEAKIETSADETRRFMKVLYEDILSRIALLGDGRTLQPS